jgi:hypothetical protein
MGTVVWLKTIQIEIRTRERNHIGRPHCHAFTADKEASIDLNPVQVLESTGFSRSDLKQILEKVQEYKEELLIKWEEYHGQIKN